MYIKNLTLQNFRNYKNATFDFSSGVNVLTGDNAQGKTNCAEAIFYLCTGYSPRATRDKQVILYGEKSCKISGTAISNYGEVNVSIDFFSNAPKHVKVNGVPLKKIGELMGNINAVFFNPEELKLIKASPEDRRRFMDISLSQMDKGYFFALQSYNKILNQRNDLLKSQDREVINQTLPLWDEQLAIYGEKIILKRKGFIEKLKPYTNKISAFITDGKEDMQISLEGGSYELEGDVKSNFYNALRTRVEKDVILGYTTAGPHRDDIKVKLNGDDVRIYGSQGQQRTCALSLKLAELEIFKNTYKEYPLLILDDALSELDANRRKRVLAKISGVQTIITCTEFEKDLLDCEYKHFEILNGTIL